VTGCAWQSKALKVGPEIYQVSANASPARGGITGARSDGELLPHAEDRVGDAL
jgi:hypothetical protein